MLKANSYYGVQQSSQAMMNNGNWKVYDDEGRRGRATSFDQFLTSIDMSNHNEGSGDDLGYLCRRILSGEDLRTECRFGYRQLFGKSLIKPTVTNITPYAVSKSLGNFVYKMIQKSCLEINSSCLEFSSSSNKLFKLFERKAPVVTSTKTSTLQQRISVIGESLSNRFSLRQSAHISPEETVPAGKSPQSSPPIPAMETITQFIYEICYSTQMEYECSVVSLVYLTRFMGVSCHKIQFNEYNWRSIVLSCMLIANKMWDDFHVSNVSYCSIFPGLTLERVNQLEIGLLTVLDFNTWVSPSQYAENHFSIQACIAEEEIKELKQKEVVAQKSREMKLSSPSGTQGLSSPLTPAPETVPNPVTAPLTTVPSTTVPAVVSHSSEKITIRTIESQSISRYHFEKRDTIAQKNIKIDENSVDEPQGVPVNSIVTLSRNPSQSIQEEAPNNPSLLLSSKANEICQFIDRTRKTLMKTSHSHLLLVPSSDMSTNQTSFSLCLPFLCHNFHIFKDKI
jgi:hypothetical protein